MDEGLICRISRTNGMKTQALVVVMLISCFLAGCTDADVEDAEQALGCTYSDAYNYEMNATEDDGSCIYDTDGDGIIDPFEVSGCTDVNANNHNSSSTDDDGSCDYDKDDDGVFDWAE